MVNLDKLRERIESDPELVRRVTASWFRDEDFREFRRAKRRMHNRGTLPSGGPWGQREWDRAHRHFDEMAERLRTDPEFRQRLVAAASGS